MTQIELDGGAHRSRDDGMCAMEYIAWLGGEEHIAAPNCACPDLTFLIQAINDMLPDEPRQRLIAYAPLVVGSRDSRRVPQRLRTIATWAERLLVEVPPRLRLRHQESYALLRDRAMDVHRMACRPAPGPDYDGDGGMYASMLVRALAVILPDLFEAAVFDLLDQLLPVSEAVRQDYLALVAA